MRKPFWREQTEYWYCEKNGRQLRLSKLGDRDPEGAARKDPPPGVQTEWHRLMREDDPQDIRFGDLLASFLDFLPEGENKTTSKNQLTRFEKHIGKETKVSLLKPFTLTKYLEQNSHWRPSSVRTFVNRLHACLNWGVRQGIVSDNPISSVKGYKREGRNERRRGVISESDRVKAEEQATPEFRAVLVALRETGARPTEIANARVEKINLSDGYFSVPNKTAHLTGEAERKIYLSPAARNLFESLIEGRIEGNVFRNAKGDKWTIQALKKRWENVRKATGVTGSLRWYRRTFASKAINDRNVNPALVATLLGHADLTMLLKHYLDENPAALRAAVASITEPPPDSRPETVPGRKDR